MPIPLQLRFSRISRGIGVLPLALFVIAFTSGSTSAAARSPSLTFVSRIGPLKRSASAFSSAATGIMPLSVIRAESNATFGTLRPTISVARRVAGMVTAQTPNSSENSCAGRVELTSM